MSTRLRQFGPVFVVLVLTAVGFFIARAHGESDARRDSSHRAEIAATGVHDRVVQATTLADGVRRFLAAPDSAEVTTEQFADIGARWLGPVGLPAAAWIERVPAAERSGYERRTGYRIVVPTSAAGLALAGPRREYLPATLVTRNPPMSASGVDLAGSLGIVAAVERPQTAYRASATPLGKLPDGTSGLFLVQSAQRLSQGVVEPGFVVLFIPTSWLLAGAADTGGANQRAQITVGGGSSGDLGSAATTHSTFAAAGQRFDVEVPLLGVQGAAAAQPWMIGGAGLMLAALAAALGVFAARRTTAKAEVDRLFNLSSDLIVVVGFDGYYKRVNPSFETKLGYTPQEALAQPYVEFVHPDDREATEARRRRLTAGETNVSFENRYIGKDGSIRSIEWTATPVAKERLTYAVGRDVTERRWAEAGLREAEVRNRALAEEQAALRRVATLVARGVPAEELFAAVSEEAGLLLSVEYASLARYESDAAATTIAFWGRTGRAAPVGRRLPLGGKNVTTLVFETGRPARIDGYADATGSIAEVGREFGIGSAIGTPVLVDGRLWGTMGAYSAPGKPLPENAERRLASFSDLLATAIANAESRGELARLAEQQAALRHVATLVAEGVPPDELFAAVTEAVGQLLRVNIVAMGRYEPDGTSTTVASWSTGVKAFPVGRRWVRKGINVTALVFETGRPARMDDFADASGPVGITARDAGYRSAVGTPIMVEGRLWGLISASSTSDEPLPSDTEERLASFTELVATAIANAEISGGLARMAGQQAALRRVATLVAEGMPPADVFSALCEEVSLLVDAESSMICRLEENGQVTVVAVSGTSSDTSILGTQFEPGSDSAIAAALTKGGPARRDDFSHASGPLRGMGIRSGVGIPIVVEGAIWGIVAIGTVRERFPDDTAQRLEEFTQLAATAVANAENRSALAASRARIVAASDETRRRIERDLHDGTQQRLVSLSLQLRLAESSVPPAFEEARDTIEGVADELNRVIDELREISRGIHPAILSEGGLGPALRTLARRSAIPVQLGNVIDHRLPEPVEVAAYYVVSEALTNAAKHANAPRVNIDADMRGGSLRLSIRDDGVGGANPVGGSGLIGLRDRVEALGGSIEIDSPPGRGTRVTVQLPVEPSVTQPQPSHAPRPGDEDAEEHNERDGRRASQPPSAR